MAYNGSGTFLRVMNWTSDAQALIPIRADRHDTQDDDYAAGLTNCLTRDGQSQPTNDIPLNGHKITNLANPVNPQDAATKSYADTPKPYTGGVEISGADANGLLNFSATTGVNGLSWKGADLSWLARLATAAGPGTPPVPPATLNRLVLNTKPDGTGTDVVTCNDDGSMSITGAFSTSSAITANGGAVIAVGASASMQVKPTSGNGALYLYAVDGTTARTILYTSSGAQGNANLTVGSSNFAFQPSGIFNAPSTVFAGAAQLQTNGNVLGNIWTNFAGGVNDAYTAIYNQIENRANAYAAGRVSVTQMQRVGNTYSGNVGDQNGWQCPAGTVIVGYARVPGTSGAVYGLYYMTLQIYDNINGWRNMGG